MTVLGETNNLKQPFQFFIANIELFKKGNISITLKKDKMFTLNLIAIINLYLPFPEIISLLVELLVQSVKLFLYLWHLVAYILLIHTTMFVH